MDIWLQSFLKAKTSSAKPDGRQLFAYRMTTTEYTELGALLRRKFNAAQLRDRQTLPKLLVLFMSEHWRRTYEGGPHNWEVFFKALGQPTPALSWTDCLEEAFSYWKRPLLKGPSGNRQFVLTVAHEGGLPLKLLKDTGRISKYVIGLINELSSAEAKGMSTKLKYERGLFYAKDQDYLLLPAMRNSNIYELTYELADVLIEFKSKLDFSAPNPLEQLKQKDPNWADKLPFNIEDEGAQKLLKTIFFQVKHLEAQKDTEAQTFLGFIPELNTDVSKDEMRRYFRSGRYKKSVLSDAFGIERLPTRLEFYAHRMDRSPEWIATGYELDDACFYIDSAYAHDTHLSGWNEIYLSAVASDGSQFGPISIANSDLLEVPLTFNKDGIYLGAGSLQTSREEVYVFYNSDTFTLCAGATVEELGDDFVLARDSLTFQAEDGLLIHIRLKQEKEESVGNLLVRGRLSIWESTSGEPIYDGNLSFLSTSSPRLLREQVLQWKPESGRRFVPWNTECWGKGTLRYLEGGEIKGLKKLIYLPSDLSITFDTTQSGQPACLIAHPSLATVDVDAAHCVSQEHIPNGVKIALKRDKLKGVSMIPVKLTFKNGSSVEIKVTYPEKGYAIINSKGEVIANDQVFSLDSSAGLRVLAAGYSRQEKVYLYIRSARTGYEKCVELMDKTPLRRGGMALKILDVYTLRKELELFLTADSDLDGELDLEVLPLGVRSQGRKKIKVKRYDSKLNLDRATGLLSLEKGNDAVVIPSEAKLEISKLILHEAQTDTQVLASLDRHVWELPFAAFERGPWLLTLKDGEHALTRPLLCTIDETKSEKAEYATHGTLDACLKERHPQTRLEAIKSELMRWAEGADLKGETWKTLQSYFATLGRLPTETFDVVKVLSKTPQALVMAFCLCDPRLNMLVHKHMPELSFAWELLPLSAWKAGIDKVRSYHVDLDTQHPSLEGMFTGDFETKLKAFMYHAKLDIVYGILKGDYNTMPADIGMRLGAEHLNEDWNKAKTDFLARYGKDDQDVMDWPQVGKPGESKSIWDYLPSECQHHYRTLIKRMLRVVDPTREAFACAPAIAAIYAVEGLTPSDELIFELKHMRLYDEAWYLKAFNSFFGIFWLSKKN